MVLTSALRTWGRWLQKTGKNKIFKIKTMPIYTQDIADSVPLLSVWAALFMIASMRDKWHWFVLLPLILCVVGVWLLYHPSSYLPYVSVQRKQSFVRGTIITITTLIVMLSVLLEPETETKTQVVLRGVALLVVSLLPIYTTFATASSTHTYAKLFAMLVSVLSLVLTIAYILLKPVRTPIYTAFSGIIAVFIVYYMLATSNNLVARRKQQQYSIGGLGVLRPLSNFNNPAKRKIKLV